MEVTDNDALRKDIPHLWLSRCGACPLGGTRHWLGRHGIFWGSYIVKLN